MHGRPDSWIAGKRHHPRSAQVTHLRTKMANNRGRNFGHLSKNPRVFTHSHSLLLRYSLRHLCWLIRRSFQLETLRPVPEPRVFVMAISAISSCARWRCRWPAKLKQAERAIRVNNGCWEDRHHR
jgi:hypothetical protein